MSSGCHCQTTAEWAAGTGALLWTETAPEPVPLSGPREFKGEGGPRRAEGLLTAGFAGCFVSTFRVIAATFRFAYESLDVTVRGTLGIDESGRQFRPITLRPRLVVDSAGQRETGKRLLEKTARACLISEALKRRVTLEPTVLLAEQLRAA